MTEILDQYKTPGLHMIVATITITMRRILSFQEKFSYTGLIGEHISQIIIIIIKHFSIIVVIAAHMGQAVVTRIR